MTEHQARKLASLTTPLLLIALLAVFVLLVGAFGDRSLGRMAAETLIRVTLVVGFWIFVGNSGVVSFGHAAFACVGAYVSAWVTLKPEMKTLLLTGLPDWLAQAEWHVLPAAVAAIAVAAVYATSASGLALRATREDEVAASASGIDRYRHRLAAYTVSAFFCGVGGALMGHFIGVINPDGFYLSLTFL